MRRSASRLPSRRARATLTRRAPSLRLLLDCERYAASQPRARTCTRRATLMATCTRTTSWFPPTASPNWAISAPLSATVRSRRLRWRRWRSVLSASSSPRLHLACAPTKLPMRAHAPSCTRSPSGAWGDQRSGRPSLSCSSRSRSCFELAQKPVKGRTCLETRVWSVERIRRQIPRLFVPELTPCLHRHFGHTILVRSVSSEGSLWSEIQGALILLWR
mmetsp:Transcript_12978/g.29887  ORF Transcript_12978/g.29887 Transcript_12978/m.29887 type:complete len:218 (+) Transcript_12978:1041-1694(+)